MENLCRADKKSSPQYEESLDLRFKFQKLISGNECSTIFPEFETHSAIAYFTHPVVGSVILVDVDGVLFLVSNLRSHFDDSTVRASVQVSFITSFGSNECVSQHEFSSNGDRQKLQLIGAHSSVFLKVPGSSSCLLGIHSPRKRTKCSGQRTIFEC